MRRGEMANRFRTSSRSQPRQAHPVPEAGDPEAVLVARLLFRRRLCRPGQRPLPFLRRRSNGDSDAVFPARLTLAIFDHASHSAHARRRMVTDSCLGVARCSLCGRFCDPSRPTPANRPGHSGRFWILSRSLSHGATDVFCSRAAPRGDGPLGPDPRPDSADRHDRQHSGDPDAGAGCIDGPAAGGQHHHRGDHAADDALRADAAGVQHLSLAAAGHDAVPPGAERGHHAADPHPRGQPTACWRPAAWCGPSASSSPAAPPAPTRSSSA